MEKKRITYLAPDKLEWVVSINVGKGVLKVKFTGGASCEYGNYPAEYTTSDPVIQAIIESSALFRSGQIRKGHTTIIKESRIKEPGDKQQDAPSSDRKSAPSSYLEMSTDLLNEKI